MLFTGFELQLAHGMHEDTQLGSGVAVGESKKLQSCVFVLCQCRPSIRQLLGTMGMSWGSGEFRGRDSLGS